MATTRIIAMHRNKGCTVEQALKARLDYIKNPEKTRDGELVTAFACHAATADAEFALARKEYFEITGRWRENEVIAYQIRQSFKPGEVTAEEAHQIGIELAQRFLKGNHAFVVATHTDRRNIHNHLEWSAVTLDGMGKFRNFLGSGRAVARLSDQICMEHKLSVIERPQHTGVSYNKWLGDKAIPSQRDTLRNALDEVLAQKPGSFEALLAAVEQKGWEIKRGKQVSFRGPREKRFKRLDTLGEAYAEETLRAVLAGERVHVPRQQKKTRRAPQTMQVSLLVDVQAKLRAGKGTGYANWAKKFNLKQMAQTLNWLSDHGIQDFEELSAKVDAASAERRELLKQARAAEKRLNEIFALRKQVVTYARTRKVFEAYRQAGYSKKFAAEHREELEAYRGAKRVFQDMEQAKIPSGRELQVAFEQALAEKRDAYAAYWSKQQEWREMMVVKGNVKQVLRKQEYQQEDSRTIDKTRNEQRKKSR